MASYRLRMCWTGTRKGTHVRPWPTVHSTGCRGPEHDRRAALGSSIAARCAGVEAEQDPAGSRTRHAPTMSTPPDAPRLLIPVALAASPLAPPAQGDCRRDEQGDPVIQVGSTLRLYERISKRLVTE